MAWWVAVVLLVWWGLIGDVHGVTYVTKCADYLFADTYILQNDISVFQLPTDKCLSIPANSVFDGNGFQIISTSGAGTAVLIYGNNAVVKGTTISGFAVGIHANLNRDNQNPLFGVFNATIFNNTIQNFTDTGIKAVGSSGRVRLNRVSSLATPAITGIYQIGNNIVNMNSVSSISGTTPTGIIYTSNFGPNAGVMDNTITGVSYSGRCGSTPQAAGMIINSVDPLIVYNNSISNIGGGQLCTTVVTPAVSTGIIFNHLSGLNNSDSYVIGNTVLGVTGGATGGDAKGFFCVGGPLTPKIVYLGANSFESILATGPNSTAFGISLIDYCAIHAVGNAVTGVTGPNAFGLTGGNAYGYIYIQDTNISRITATATGAVPVGFVVALPESILWFNLTMINNRVEGLTYKYYLYQPVSGTDSLCAADLAYQVSDNMCFPPGSNCCSSKCIPLCAFGQCGPDCGPLPNCTDCGYDCGDGKCSASENCTTCSADCICPSTCGNKLCETGETCQSCPRDCPCNPACGNPPCSGNGVCVDAGICECSGNFSGPLCERKSIEFNYDTNITYPGTVISFADRGQSYSFNTRLHSISELLDNNTVLKTFYFSNITFAPIPLWFASLFLPNTTQLYNCLYGSLPNGAKVIYTMFKVTERTIIPFGKFNISLPPQAMKYNVDIWFWPFLSTKNKLKVVTKTATSSNLIYRNGIDSFGNIRYQEINDPKTNASLFIKVQPFLILDGNLTFMQVNRTENENEIATIIPFFWVRALYDPDYSVLVDSNGGSSGGQTTKPSNKLDKNAIIIGIVVPVGVLIIIIVAIVVIYPRIREGHQVKQSERARSTQMQSSESRASLTTRM